MKNAYAACFLFAVLLFKHRLAIVLWFLFGIAWGIGHEKWVGDPIFLEPAVIKHAELEGVVVSIPVVTVDKTQLQFQVKRIDQRAVNARVMLSCYQHCPDFHAGQAWRLHSKLIKARNLGNPGAFDYVGWLNARHIRWTGYLKGSSQLLEAEAPHHPVLRLRQHLAEALERLLPDVKILGILQALTLGITTHIDKGSWDLFRRTGTTHLMVISGSHIGLVAGLTYGLVKWLWCRLSGLCLIFPAARVASLAGFLMAAFYALLAGFEVPSQRALIACFFMFFRPFCSQRFGVWQSWRYALFTVLLLEPHAVMMPGFYLSFMAVAVLILINQRFSYAGFRNMLLMQVACLVGLMPLTLFWFSYGAVNGLVANALAIPWVSFIIVPLGLFTLLSGSGVIFPWIVTLLRHAIEYLFYYLNWIDSFSAVNLSFSVTQFLSPLAWMIAIASFTLLPLWRFFPVVLIICIASLFPHYEKIKAGEVVLDVLDVGQGLAVAVRTAKHNLIYDTGVKFYHGGDMGKMVIIPYLKTLNVKTLDSVIISHPDLDHRGGLASLEDAYHVKELIVDDPGFYGRGSPCHDHADWTWDGISFHFFPIVVPLNSKNNSSCVLQVSTSAGKVLLSGDIEKPAEQYLSNTYGKKLASTVLVIPHHASKTSSSALFIDQVRPLYAIASYGFDNRYHFPHQQALQTYKTRAIPIYNTVDCGMIRIHMKATSMGALSGYTKCLKKINKGVHRGF